VDQCAELLSPVDQDTAGKITEGCPNTTTSKSKLERTRIIKLQVPLRSWVDFNKLMTTTKLRNIPENVKKPFTVHRNIKLNNMYKFISDFRQLCSFTLSQDVPGKIVSYAEKHGYNFLLKYFINSPQCQLLKTTHSIKRLDFSH
jgi:hypothetical protein